MPTTPHPAQLFQPALCPSTPNPPNPALGGDLQRGSMPGDKYIQQSMAEHFGFAIYARKKWLEMKSKRKANASVRVHTPTVNPSDCRAAKPRLAQRSACSSFTLKAYCILSYERQQDSHTQPRAVQHRRNPALQLPAAFCLPMLAEEPTPSHRHLSDKRLLHLLLVGLHKPLVSFS